MAIKDTGLFPEIEKFIGELDIQTITNERKFALQPLIAFIQSKVASGEEIRINFICTHNSRRSHLAQVWAQTMAHYFQIKQVFCYSGGTKATALFPKVVETLQNVGFAIKKICEAENPIYSIKYGRNQHPTIGFSKKMADEFNPKSKFAAVMTCSQADGDCPLIEGAEQRISLPFEDPKVFDGTPQQAAKYEERSQQIAAELLYVFSHITL